MVNFDNESTLTVDKKDVVTFILIEAHYYAIENIKLYDKQMAQKMKPVVKPSLISSANNLYNLCYPAISKYAKKDLKDNLLTNYEAKDIENKIQLIKDLSMFLWDIGVLQIGVKKKIDPKDILGEDENKGL